MRHSSTAELRRNPLSYIILDAVRLALHAPKHPDASRQYRAWRRTKALKQARAIKAAPVAVVAPPDPEPVRRPNRFFIDLHCHPPYRGRHDDNAASTSKGDISMASKITITFSSAQADALVKALGQVPKQTKTVEALAAKISGAKNMATI